MPYKCDICNQLFETLELRSDHINTKIHEAKKELKYMTLKFEDKLDDTKIEELFIHLENSFI